MHVTVHAPFLEAIHESDWAGCKDLVQQSLKAIGSGPAKESVAPAPSTPFPTASQNVKDALHNAQQKYELYRMHHPIFGSKDRSAYRKALLNLWDVLSFYEQNGAE